MKAEDLSIHEVLSHQTTIIRDIVAEWANIAELTPDQWDRLNTCVFNIINPLCTTPYVSNQNERTINERR